MPNEVFPALLAKEQVSSKEYDSEMQASTGLLRVFVEKNFFGGFRKSYEPKEEGGIKYPSERLEIRETPKGALLKMKDLFCEAVDNSVSKEFTNLKAVTDVNIIGVDCGALPATALLNLEKKLRVFEKFLANLPIYDTSIKWEELAAEPGIYQQTTEKYRTEKVTKPIEKAPATKEHRAQVDLINVDEIVGTWTSQVLTSCLPPDKHAKMLANVRSAIKDVISARERANHINADIVNIGEGIFNAITEV